MNKISKKETTGKTAKGMKDKSIKGKDIINTVKCDTLYSTLNTDEFPCFAALMSAGFEFTDLQCRVEFAPYGDYDDGISIYFSYRFEGYGDFIPMESIHIKDLEDGLEAWILTEISYACVRESPKFYNQLIKTLPHGECMMEQIELFNDTLNRIIAMK